MKNTTAILKRIGAIAAKHKATEAELDNIQALNDLQSYLRELPPTDNQYYQFLIVENMPDVMQYFETLKRLATAYKDQQMRADAVKALGTLFLTVGQLQSQVNDLHYSVGSLIDFMRKMTLDAKGWQFANGFPHTIRINND